MKNSIIILFLMLTASPLFAKQRVYMPPHQSHTIFVEIGGNGLVYSANYEFSSTLNPKSFIIYRAGVGYLNLPGFQASTIPSEVSFARGFAVKHFVEFGSGISFFQHTQNNATNQSLYMAIRAGYRFQQNEGGLFFKAGITPMLPLFHIQKETEPLRLPFFAGIGIGYTFSNYDCGCKH